MQLNALLGQKDSRNNDQKKTEKQRRRSIGGKKTR